MLTRFMESTSTKQWR